MQPRGRPTECQQIAIQRLCNRVGRERRGAGRAMVMAAVLIAPGIVASVSVMSMIGRLGPVRRVVLMRLRRSGMKTGPNHRHGGEKDEEVAHAAVR